MLDPSDASLLRGCDPLAARLRSAGGRRAAGRWTSPSLIIRSAEGCGWQILRSKYSAGAFIPAWEYAGYLLPLKGT